MAGFVICATNLFMKWVDAVSHEEGSTHPYDLFLEQKWQLHTPFHFSGCSQPPSSKKAVGKFGSYVASEL